MVFYFLHLLLLLLWNVIWISLQPSKLYTGFCWKFLAPFPMEQYIQQANDNVMYQCYLIKPGHKWEFCVWFYGCNICLESKSQKRDPLKISKLKITQYKGLFCFFSLKIWHHRQHNDTNTGQNVFWKIYFEGLSIDSPSKWCGFT